MFLTLHIQLFFRIIKVGETKLQNYEDWKISL